MLPFRGTHRVWVWVGINHEGRGNSYGVLLGRDDSRGFYFDRNNSFGVYLDRND